MVPVRSLSRVILATVVIATTQAVFAVDAETPVVTVSQSEIKFLDEQIAAYQKKAEERNTAAALLAKAKSSKAGWTVAIDLANDAKPYGKAGLYVLIPARVILPAYKDEFALAKKLTRPTTGLLTIAGTVYAVGLASNIAGQTIIDLSDNQVQQFRTQIETTDMQLEQQAYVIKELAGKMPGVVISNNQIMGLPEGLKSLGGGSLLNLGSN